MGVGVNSYYLKLFPSTIVFILLPTVMDIDPPKVNPVAIRLLAIDLLQDIILTMLEDVLSDMLYGVSFIFTTTL